VALAAVFVVACATARFTGALNVDGRPFVPRRCAIGAKEKFYGVDLTDADGRVLRLAFAEKPPGAFPYPHPGVSRPSVVAFKPSGALDWESLGPCGPLLVQQGEHKGVLDGDMHLHCVSAAHAVEGRMAFDNCY
jgi:hypothetical protein